jgi:hypothetical protein
VPKVYGNEDKIDMKLIGASDVELSDKTLSEQGPLELRKSYGFRQQISAYITPVEYEELLSEQETQFKDQTVNISSKKFEFTGKYGSGLFKEISRYGIVASEIARNEPHNIIHVHDWLTYPAGIEAKKVSGNPLIVHVHSMEFDRTGDNPNNDVCEIERNGMEFADKVITVSDFTRNIVIRKH